MPNGGPEHCGNCDHFDMSWGKCNLRNIIICPTYQLDTSKDPKKPSRMEVIVQAFHTTCDDMISKHGDPEPFERFRKPHGPIYSIVEVVSDRMGSHHLLPWFQGNPVHTEQQNSKDCGDTIVYTHDRDHNLLEFDSPEAYLVYWKKNTPKNEQ